MDYVGWIVFLFLYEDLPHDQRSELKYNNIKHLKILFKTIQYNLL